jgi:hypothetical protein
MSPPAATEDAAEAVPAAPVQRKLTRIRRDAPVAPVEGGPRVK